MMKSNHPVAKLRYMLFLPLMAALIISAACTQKSDLNEIEKTTENGTPISKEILSIADQMPEYPGGTAALMEYLGQNITYPSIAKEAKAEGKVFVSFVIDTSGKVTQAEVKRGVHPDLDAEAIRAVEAMPNWQPGIHEGKIVNVSYTLPINFQLQ